MDIKKTEDIIKYNPAYLSAFVVYPDATPPQYIYFSSENKTSSTNDINYFYWLYKNTHWFFGLEQKRISLVINGNTDILIRHNWTQQEIELFQKYPIAVYMYEPLFLFDATSDDPYIIGRSAGRPRCYELDHLSRFLKRHSIKNKVQVYVCDYGVKIHDIETKENYPFELETFDIFLLSTSAQLTGALHSFHESIKFHQQYFPYPEINKKALCLNYRWEAFRELIVAYLRSRNDFNEMTVSFFHQHDRDYFLEHMGFNPFSWSLGPSLNQAISDMQHEIPYHHAIRNKCAVSVDHALPDFSGEHNQRDFIDEYQLYFESLLSIVTESRYTTNFPCISEKTLKPMIFKRPFIILGGPYSLRYLRELGFKTFSDFWDESYDEIANPEERMKAVIKLLDNILAKDLDELKAWLLQMESILHHNHVHATFGLANHYREKMFSHKG